MGHLLLLFHIRGRPDAAALSKPPSPSLLPSATRPIAAGWDLCPDGVGNVRPPEMCLNTEIERGDK